MVPPDVQQWINQQLVALKYVDPPKVQADVVAALELKPNWRPRTEYITSTDILLVLHAIDSQNYQIVVPRAYPWQSPLITENGVRKSTPPQTSVAVALQMVDKPAVPSRDFRPPLPQKLPAKPPLPPRASSASPAPQLSLQLPPHVPPQLPPRVQSVSRSIQVSPADNSQAQSAYSTYHTTPTPPAMLLPDRTRVSTEFLRPSAPSRPLPADMPSTQSLPVQLPAAQSSAAQSTPPNSAFAKQRSGKQEPKPPVDLMNAVNLSAPTKGEELITELVTALNSLPDPPQFASIDSDRDELLAAKAALEQRQAVLEQQKRQLLFNQTLLKTATENATKVCDLVDSQFVQPTLADLVVIKPELRAQARVEGISDTLNMLPRILDAGMDVHVYLPLVRQLAREQFRLLSAAPV